MMLKISQILEPIYSDPNVKMVALYKIDGEPVFIKVNAPKAELMSTLYWLEEQIKDLLHYIFNKNLDEASFKFSNIRVIMYPVSRTIVLSVMVSEDASLYKLEIDIVLECTGRFTALEDAKKHLLAGAKKVIISANSKTEEVPHFVLGVNEENFDPQKDNVVAMGSCTTNCVAPVLKVLNDNFGVKKGFFTTVHSYTNNQRLLDLPHKDLRRARAAALNIIPTTSGAAKAVARIIPKLKGKFTGIALRVPTPVVSITDIICQLEKATIAEEVNYTFKKASQTERLKGILGIEDQPLVSSDYKGNSFSAIVDASLTMVFGDLVKIVAWYDNEWAYACRLAEFAEYIGKKL